MLADYGYIGLFLLVATFIPILMILLPWALSLVGIRPRNPTPVKLETYESGMRQSGAHGSGSTSVITSSLFSS